MGKWWYIDSNGKRKRTKAGLKHDYETFQKGPEGTAKNTARKSARRAAERSGRVHKGDGKDVDHIHGISRGNGASNIRVISASANRARRQGSRKRGSKRSRHWTW